MSRRAASRLALAVLAAGSCAACDQHMTVQPKYETFEAAERFAHRQSALMPVAGTVPVDGGAAEPPRRTTVLLERGRERYAIYCLPCHGRYGDADGRVVAEYGFPAPPSLHVETLRAASDTHLFDVISNGYGNMYSYGARLAPADRWAVVGYLRALQLARHADVETYPELTAELGGVEAD